MKRMLWTAAASLLMVLAFMTLGARRASAYGDAPWCAVTSSAFSDHWECIYKSSEACRPNVIAGNRGFGNQPPRYHGPAKRPVPPHRRHRRR